MRLTCTVFFVIGLALPGFRHVATAPPKAQVTFYSHGVTVMVVYSVTKPPPSRAASTTRITNLRLLNAPGTMPPVRQLDVLVFWSLDRLSREGIGGDAESPSAAHGLGRGLPVVHGAVPRQQRASSRKP